MPVRRMLDQKRAAAAWSSVQTVLSQGAKLQQEYRALARGFPAMIQMNGLGAASAFLFAKAKSTGSHALLLDHLQKWLRQQLPMAEEQALTEWLIAESTSSNEYRRATIEALAYLSWLRRFAEGALAADEQPVGERTRRSQGASNHAS